MGMAVARASRTCVQLTTPGERFRLTSSLRAERGGGGIVAVGDEDFGRVAGAGEDGGDLRVEEMGGEHGQFGM